MQHASMSHTSRRGPVCRGQVEPASGIPSRVIEHPTEARQQPRADDDKPQESEPVQDGQQERLQASGIKCGDVLQGTVLESTSRYAAMLSLSGVEACLHISQISHERVEDVEAVFQEGDVLKVLVLSVALEDSSVRVSTKHLEPSPGDMLNNPQLVFDRAEEMGAQWRQQQTIPL